MVLTPLLRGGNWLTPAGSDFFMLAGGPLFGFFSILLVLPVVAIGMVVLRHAHYLSRSLYQHGKA